MSVSSMSTLWVFGYGSLIWNPGFEYSQCKVGRIAGYSRRFYQGSDVHRGTRHRMGRVATLIEEEGGTTWGRAFQFTDEESTFAYLANRESLIGGYSTVIANFHPSDPKEESFPVLVYIALPCNSLFLGSAPMDQIARDIASSKGQCGYNVEYLAKLVAFMHLHVPDVWDDHLFTLEKTVRFSLTQTNSELLSIFDDALNQDITDEGMWRSSGRHFDVNDEQSYTKREESNDSQLSQSPSKYTDTVPIRKLRCINK